MVSCSFVHLLAPKLYWSIGRTNCSYYSTRVALYSHQILLGKVRQLSIFTYNICFEFRWFSFLKLGNSISSPLCLPAKKRNIFQPVQTMSIAPREINFIQIWNLIYLSGDCIWICSLKNVDGHFAKTSACQRIEETKCIFLNDIPRISINSLPQSLSRRTQLSIYVPKYVRIKAWRRTGIKSLSESMMVLF